MSSTLTREYRYVERPDRAPEHMWFVFDATTKTGAHLWICDHSTATNPDGVYGGIEIHYPNAPEHRDPAKPDFEHCWFTGCKCWTDGSSLAADTPIALFRENGGLLDNETGWEFAESMLRSRIGGAR